jgi:hypothetical protein
VYSILIYSILLTGHQVEFLKATQKKYASWTRTHIDWGGIESGDEDSEDEAGVNGSAGASGSSWIVQIFGEGKDSKENKKSDSDGVPTISTIPNPHDSKIDMASGQAMAYM